MKTTLLAACLSGMMMLNAQNPSLQWAAKMGGTLHDYPNSIAIDAGGNVYTAGAYKGTADFDPGVSTYTLQAAGGSDAFISKLDASGNFVWAKQLSGTLDDLISGLTVDATGNIYSIGSFSGTADFDPGASLYTLSAQGTQDVFISKLDAAGNFVWAKQLGAGGASISGRSLTLDPSGNVHLAGTINGTVDVDPGAGTYTLSSGGNVSSYIVTLDASGSFIRAEHYAGSSSLYIRKIVSDASGNIYAAGSFAGTADFDAGAGTYTLTGNGGGFDAFILKTNAAGNMLWAKNIGGANLSNPTSIAVDLQQNVYTIGIFSGSMDFDPGPGTYFLSSSSVSGVDTYVLKLDASGNFSRAQLIGDPLSSCNGQDIIANAAGSTYVIGNYNGSLNLDPGISNSTLSSNGNFDVFTLELNPGGDFVWAQSIGNTGNDIALSVAMDASSRVYTAGTFEGTVDVDPGTGITNLTSAGAGDVFIQKLNQGATGLKKTERLGDLRLYPNPASHFLKFEITDPELASTLTSLAVAELVTPLGQVIIREQISRNDLTFDISTVSPGLYFVRISQKDAILLNQKIIKE